MKFCGKKLCHEAIEYLLKKKMICSIWSIKMENKLNWKYYTYKLLNERKIIQRKDIKCLGKKMSLNNYY